MDKGFHTQHSQAFARLTSLLVPSRDTEMPDSPDPDIVSPSPSSSSDSYSMPSFSLALALADSPVYSVSPMSSDLASASPSFVASHTPEIVLPAALTAPPSAPAPLPASSMPLLNGDARLGSDTEVELILPTVSAYSAVVAALATLALPPNVLRFNPLMLPATGRQMLIDAQDPFLFRTIIDRVVPAVQEHLTLRAFVVTPADADVAGLSRVLAARASALSPSQSLSFGSSSSSSNDFPVPMAKRTAAWDR